MSAKSSGLTSMRGPAGAAGQGAHPPPRRLQLARDGRAGVAELPCHHVEAHPRAPRLATSAPRIRPRGASTVAVAQESPRVAPWLTITTWRPSFAACRTYLSPDITVSDEPRTSRALDASTIE